MPRSSISWSGKIRTGLEIIRICTGPWTPSGNVSVCLSVSVCVCVSGVCVYKCAVWACAYVCALMCVSVYACGCVSVCVSVFSLFIPATLLPFALLLEIKVCLFVYEFYLSVCLSVSCLSNPLPQEIGRSQWYLLSSNNTFCLIFFLFTYAIFLRQKISNWIVARSFIRVFSYFSSN